jgi:hypothetical protein
MKYIPAFSTPWSAARFVAAALLCASTGSALAAEPEVNTAVSLRAKFVTLKDQLGQTQFQQPLYMESQESSGGVTGEIYALISYPFATVGAELNKPAQWCDIMILHINTKYCRASISNQGSVLNVNIGKKFDQPLEEAYPVIFAYRVAVNTGEFLRVRLSADKGPLSTRNYRIVLEAIPLENGRTFMHLSYAYDYGFTGRIAMQAYLATVGRNKVGFTIVGKQPDGQPEYVGGMRGLVERNTMRYYLAIEAFMGALASAPQARMEKSLHDWFAAAEHYPRQLHEMEQNDYLEMKRKEYLRQQTAVLTAAAFAPVE